MTIDVFFNININPEELIDRVSFGFQSIGYLISQREKTRVVLHFKSSTDKIISIDVKEDQVRIIASGKDTEAHAKDLIKQLINASLIYGPAHI
jgi:hypothetical protein